MNETLEKAEMMGWEPKVGSLMGVGKLSEEQLPAMTQRVPSASHSSFY